MPFDGVSNESPSGGRDNIVYENKNTHFNSKVPVHDIKTQTIDCIVCKIPE